MIRSLPNTSAHPRNMIVRTALIGLMLLSGIFSGTAHATGSCTITGTTSIAFGTINVPRDAVVGTAFGTAQTASYTMKCPAGNPQGITPILISNDSVSTTVTNVWNTGIAGIGIRVTDTSFGNAVLSSTASGSKVNIGATTGKTNATTTTYTFSLQLIKTGQVATSGGIVITNLYSLGEVNLNTSVQNTDLGPVSISGTTISAQSCSVTTPSLSVSLPTLSTSAFPAVGSTAGPTSFTLGLNCTNGNTANVYMTLTDSNNTGNTSNLLSLASGSAGGMALQILFKGSPISFGPDAATAGNTNQFLIGGPASGISTVPMTVRYYRTGTITPGAVNAQATFTMSYQ